MPEHWYQKGRGYQEGGAVEEDPLAELRALGAPGERVDAPEEVDELGRDVDLSALGAAGTDPVSAAYEFARTGEGPSFETLEQVRAGQSGLSPFPMEPGTSRASRELPEFFGDFPEIPESRAFHDEMQRVVGDPDSTFLERMGAGMYLAGPPGSGGMRPARRHRVSGMGAGLSKTDVMKIMAAGLTMYDPAEFAQVLLQRDPETGERMYPQYSITQAPDGAFVATNSINGAQAVLNRPGMSTLDGAQMLTAGVLFTPAGRATAAVGATFPRILVGASTAAATEAGIQYGHELAGGEFDVGDVAITGAIGPVVDLVRPFIGGIQRVGRFIGSYIPEDLGAQIGAKTGLGPMIGRGKEAAIQFANNAREWLQSARPAILMTEDALPEIHTPRIKILLKMAERMIWTGTGGPRKKQVMQRMEVLRHLADRFNLNPATNYGARVIDDINRSAGDAMETAVRQRAQAVDDLVDTDIIIRDFRLKIRDLIENESRYGDMANQGLIDLLNTARTSVWRGGVPKPGPLPRGFGIMDDWLQRLRMHANEGSPAQRQALTEAADALEADLRRHAAEAGEAGAQWLRSMDDTAALVAQAEGNTLSKLIAAGEIDETVMRRVLRGGDEGQMRQLFEALTPEGRQAAQSMMLRNALRVGGWRRGMPAEMEVDVNKIVKMLESDAVENQMRVFFPDEADQQMFAGMLEYLKRTADAQRIGQGAGIAAAGGIKNLAKDAGANAVNLLTAGLYGFAARGWQSAPVRNVLLRLYHAGSDQRLKDNIMREATGILMGMGRQFMQEETAEDPQDWSYISAAAQDTMEEKNDLGIMMDQLRSITGQDEQDREDVAAQLETMRQEMRDMPIGEGEEGNQ